MPCHKTGLASILSSFLYFEQIDFLSTPFDFESANFYISCYYKKIKSLQER